jgi:ATP-binding cassette subfamily B protein
MYLSPFNEDIHWLQPVPPSHGVYHHKPQILGQITNELVRGVMVMTSGGTGGIDFVYVGKIILILLGLYVISMLFSYLQGFTMANISTKIEYDLRNSMMAKINKLPVSIFQKMTHGEVLSRITNDSTPLQ